MLNPAEAGFNVRLLSVFIPFGQEPPEKGDAHKTGENQQIGNALGPKHEFMQGVDCTFHDRNPGLKVNGLKQMNVQHRTSNVQHPILISAI